MFQHLAKLVDDDDEELALFLTAAVVSFQFVEHANLAAFHVEASLQQDRHLAIVAYYFEYLKLGCLLQALRIQQVLLFPLLL